MSQKPIVNRRDFIRKFMHEAGLTFDQACRAYASLIGIIEDSLVSGHQVKFGKVGSLYPVRKPPRDIAMGFSRLANGRIVKTKRIFHLDERTAYRFNFHREFARRHQLRG